MDLVDQPPLPGSLTDPAKPGLAGRLGIVGVPGAPLIPGIDGKLELDEISSISEA
jgi:hypothetical protein